MKKGTPTPHSVLRTPLFAAALLVLAALFSINPALHAASYYIWDPSGTGPLTDGGGTWSTTGTTWYTGGAALQGTYGAWPSNNYAVFGIGNGAAGTITVSGSVNVNTITFNQAGSGNYTLNSGTIGLSTASIVANANATIGSTLAGTAGLTLTGTGTTLTLTGSNNFTGTITTTFDTLTLNSAAGLLTGANAVTLKGGTLNVDNVGSSAAYSGTFGALTFSAGDGTVQTTQTVAQNEALKFSSLAARTAGATGNFVNGGNATNGTTNGFVLTGVTANSFIDNGVFYGGANYAWNDAGGFVRAINYTTGTNAATNSGGTVLSGSAFQQITGSITAQTTATITNLNLTNNSSLTLASGSLTVNGLLASGATASTISGGASIEAASGAELVIRTDTASDSLTISTPILANGANALTKSGAGTLTLSAANTYTGVTYLDGGILNLGNASALGGGGNITFNGGTLQYSSANTVDYSGKIANSTGAISIDTNGQTVTFLTTLASTNTGGLIKNGSGLLVLGTANSYTGNTIINSGTLKLGAAVYALPQSIVQINSGGTLDWNNQNIDGKWIAGLSGNGNVVSSSGGSSVMGIAGGPNNNGLGNSTVTFTGSFGTLANQIQLDYRAGNQIWNWGGTAYIKGSNFGWGVAPANASTINVSGTINSNGGNIGYVGSTTLNILSGGVWNQGTSAFGIGYTNNPGETQATNAIVNVSGSLVNITDLTSKVSGTTGMGVLNVNTGGVVSVNRIYEYSTANLSNPFTLTFNGGTVSELATGNLFTDGGGNNELSVQIGANGGTINTNAFTATSQRPLMNVSGSSTAGTLTKVGSGTLNLTATGSFTGRVLVNQGTVSISNDASLGVAPAAPVANQVELNGGTMNFSSGLTSVTQTSYSSGSSASIATATTNNVTGGLVKLSNSILAITGGTGVNTTTGGGNIDVTGVTVYIAPPDMPGGVQAVATANIVGTGTSSAITGYTMTNVGSGYSAVPYISVFKTSLGINGGDNAALGGLSGLGFEYGLSGSAALLFDNGIIPSGSTTSITYNNISGTASVTTSSSLSLAANRGIQLDGSGGTLDVSTYPTGFTATVNGAISGVGALTKTGSGILILTNTTNSYAGGTVINGGILDAPSASVLPNYSTNLRVNSGGTLGLLYGGPSDWTSLQVDGLLSGTSFAAGSGIGFDTTNASGTYNSNITNTVSLTKLGANTLTLGGANTYNGGTVIDGGVLSLASSGALGSTGNISFGGGILQGILQYSGANTTDYSSRITSIGGAISIDTNGQSVTFGSAFLGTNAYGLTKSGSGSLLLSASNGTSLTGTITINGGTLKTGNLSSWDNTYGGVSVPLVLNSGTYDINGIDNKWVGQLTGSAGAVVTNNGASGKTFLFGGTSVTGTYAGSFQNGTGLLNVNWRGTAGSVLTLTGSSTVANFQVGDNNTSTLILAPGSYLSTSFLAVGENSAGNEIDVNGGTVAAQDLNSNTIRIGWNGSGNSGFVLNSGTVTAPFINRSGGNGPSTYLTLNGGVLYTKEIRNDIYGGTGMTATLNGGTIINTNNDYLFMDSGYLSGTQELLVQIGANGGTINSNGFTTISQRPLMNVSGSATAGTLTITGSGSMNLTGTGTFTGKTLINGGGTLKIATDGNLGVAPGSPVANQIEMNGGTLTLASKLTGVTLTSGSGVLTSSSAYGTYGTITTSVNNATGAFIKFDNSISAIVGGTGANGGTGLSGVTITFSAPDMPGGVQATATATVVSGTITGYTITNAGSGYSHAPSISIGKSAGTAPTTPTLQFQLDGNSPVLVDEGVVTGTPTMSFTAYNSGPAATLTSSTSMALAANRGIQLDGSGGTLAVSAPTGFVATVNGAISGSGALTASAGTGILILTASNSYTGGTIVTSGSLQLANAFALGATAGNLAVNGGTLDLNGYNQTVGVLSGSSGGIITTSTSGSITLTANSASSGTFGGIIQDGSGQLNLTKAGTGTLTLSGANIYTGLTAINGGVLALNNAATMSTGTITFGGGTLQFLASNVDYSAIILNSGSAISIDTTSQAVGFAIALASSNTGGLTVMSSSSNGYLQLLSSPLYSGATTIASGGTLKLGDSSSSYDDASLNNSSSIVTNGSLVFLTTGTQTNTVAISGSGTVGMSGPGLQILSGTNSYSGGTNLGGGTLNFNNVNALGGGTVTFTANSTLQAGLAGTFTDNMAINPSVTGTFDTQGFADTLSGIISGSGALAKIGSGTLTLTNSNSYTGGTKLNAGILALGNSGALSGSGNISFGGGTLQYTSGVSTDYSARIANSGSAVTIDTNGQNVTFASVFGSGDTGGLVKTGSGTLLLNAEPGLSGGFTINSGTLKQGVATAIGNAGQNNLLTVNSGATFDMNGLSDYWITGVAGSGSVISSAGANPVLFFIYGNNGVTSVTYTGNLGDSAHTIGMDYRTKNQTWNLSGTDYFNGVSFGWGSTPAQASTLNFSGSASVISPTFGNTGSYIANILAGGTWNAIGTNLGIGNTGNPGESATDNAIVNVSGALINNNFISSSLAGITGTAALNVNTGGIVSTKSIFEYNTAYQTNTFTLTLNGGTFQALSSTNLFADNGGVNELGVQIGANGGTIDTNGFTATSQRPLMNVTGSSTAGTLTVIGGGSLNLSGSGTFTGQTLVNGGTVKISSDGNLGAAPVSPVANQVELNGGTLNFSSALNSVNLTAYSSGSSTAIATATVSGATGAYVKLDNKILAITGGTGVNTRTGGGNIDVTGVTVFIAPPDMPGGVQATAHVVIAGTGTNAAITGYVIDNPGSGYSSTPYITLYKTSMGLNGGDNAQIAGITTMGWEFGLSGSAATLFSEGIVTGATTLNIQNSAGTSGSLTTTTSLALAANRGIQLDASGGTLDVSNAPTGFTATVNGVVSGSGALTKTGSGTLVLAASNSYSGSTTVSGGTMIVSGSLTATTSASVSSGAALQVDGLLNTSATVSVAGTLKGTGSVGAVSVQNGGTLAPGHSPGILTVSNGLTFSGTGAKLSIVIGKTTAGAPVAGTDYSQVNVTGGSAITLNNATLTLSGVNDNFGTNNLFFLIINGTGSAVNGTFNTLGEGATLAFAGGTFQITYLANASGNSFTGGHDVALELTSIPEPGTWAMLVCGFGILLFSQRARRRFNS